MNLKLAHLNMLMFQYICRILNITNISQDLFEMSFQNINSDYSHNIYFDHPSKPRNIVNHNIKKLQSYLLHSFHQSNLSKYQFDTFIKKYLGNKMVVGMKYINQSLMSCIVNPSPCNLIYYREIYKMRGELKLNNNSLDSRSNQQIYLQFYLYNFHPNRYSIEFCY